MRLSIKSRLLRSSYMGIELQRAVLHIKLVAPQLALTLCSIKTNYLTFL